VRQKKLHRFIFATELILNSFLQPSVKRSQMWGECMSWCGCLLQEFVPTNRGMARLSRPTWLVILMKKDTHPST